MRQKTYDIISNYEITSENNIPLEAMRELALSYLEEDGISYAFPYAPEEFEEIFINDLKAGSNSDVLDYFVKETIIYYKSDIDNAIYEYRDELYSDEYHELCNIRGTSTAMNIFESEGVKFYGLTRM